MTDTPSNTQVTVRPIVDAAMPMTAADVRGQVNLIQSVMKEVMQEGQHFGKVPGCGDKPALLKPGAEKLGMVFRLAPTFKIERREMDNGHREYEVVCTLNHITSGQCYGEGVGCCSTKESKYRYRSAGRRCPACGKETIIRGKQEYGGGWLCFAKKGGCGAKYPAGDVQIESQSEGKSENPDIADTYNTVLKMAKKRAQVDAILTATAASDIFTQDIEDFAEPHATAAPEPHPQATVREPAQPAPQPQPQPATTTTRTEIFPAKILSVEAKSVNRDGKTLPCFGIHIDGGHTIVTLDAKLAAQAKDYATKKMTVEMEVEKRGEKYHLIAFLSASATAA
jgi:hypothetical protein